MEASEFSPMLLRFGYGAVIVLLIVVTVGIGYLTLAEWRDRRLRKSQEKGRIRRK